METTLQKNNQHQINAEFSIIVPSKSDGPDFSKLLHNSGLMIKIGSEMIIAANIDFLSDYSVDKKPNRQIEPIFDSDKNIIGYKITKRELVVSSIVS